MQASAAVKIALAVAETAGLLLLSVLLALVLTTVYLGADWITRYDSEAALLREAPAVLLLQAVAFVILGLLMMRLRVERDAGVRPLGVWLGLGLGVAGAVAAFALSVTLATLLDWIGLPVQEQEWVLALLEDPESLRRVLPLIVVAAPISEEVFFRGYVFRFVAGRAGPLTGYLASSLLFALVHFNATGFPIYVTIGLVLAFVYHRSATLMTPIVAHMCFNALVLLFEV